MHTLDKSQWEGEQAVARKLRWRDLYREAELYKAAVRMYTKPLFAWRKALFASTDKKDLYDFARAGLRNLEGLDRALRREQFLFRPGVALHREFHGKARTLYIYPWEERLVDLLLYRMLSGRLQAWFSANSYAYRVRGYGLDRCQRRIANALRDANGPLFVAKRDIANYFPSVNHELLLEQLAELIEPGDYLFRLMVERVRFPSSEEETTPAHLNAKRAAPEDKRRTVRAERGIAFGTAMASFFANVYVTPLDRKLDVIEGLRYFRYADDLLLMASERGVIETAIARFDEAMVELRLQSKASHEENWMVRRAGAAALPMSGKAHESKERSRASLRMTKEEEDEGFVACSRFRHLGLEFCADGQVRLSRDKFRKICNVFRFAWRRKRAKLARIKEERKRAEFVVRVAQTALEKSVRRVAIVDYYLKHVNDEAQLRLLDRWVAEEALALVFGGHRKGNFRRMPFVALRAMGLPSLVHRRRQIRHGQIAAPFFVWKSYRTRKSSREAVVKLRPRNAEAPAFSPSPEAVAATSQEDLVGERSHLSRGLIEDRRI